MNNRFVIVILTAFLAAACGKVAGEKDQVLAVEVGGLSMPSKYPFNPPDVVASKQEVQVTVYNGAVSGNARNLTINDIYLEPGGNPYISLQWKGAYDSTSFPLELKVEEGVLLSFLVIYDPEPGQVDISSATLVIDSDDPTVEDDLFKIEFTVETKGPKLCVNIDAPSANSCLQQPTMSYNCVSGCSSRLIYVGNDGTDDLEVVSIDFSKASSEFSFENPPALPLTIPPKGSPDYNPIVFSVRYCPGDDYWEDSIDVVITSNDTSLTDGVKKIPTKVVQSPALLSFSTDSPFGYLDYSAGSGTTHKINIYNKASAECEGQCPNPGQCCGCPIQIKGVDVIPPDAAPWFVITAKDPSNGSVLDLPRALKGGASIDFEILYQKPAGQSEDRNGTICVRYVAPLEGGQQRCVSALASSQCGFDIAPPNLVLHFNSSSPADVKEKPAVLINSGNAACTVTHVSVMDKWRSVSEDFSLKDVIPGETQVEPFSLLPVWVKYSPHSDTPTGLLEISYVDSVAGEVKTALTLIGTKDQDCAVPTADAGDPSLYTGVAVGASVSLNGCLSKPGECGSPLFENGYIWFLMAKPEGSTTYLNGEGPCLASFIPDVAGKYTVGLIVYDGTSFYQSQMATLDVTAK